MDCSNAHFIDPKEFPKNHYHETFLAYFWPALKKESYKVLLYLFDCVH